MSLPSPVCGASIPRLRGIPGRTVPRIPSTVTSKARPPGGPRLVGGIIRKKNQKVPVPKSKCHNSQYYEVQKLHD